MPTVDDHTLLHLSIAALSGLLGLTVYFFKKKMEAYDEHLKTCSQKAEETADTRSRLKTVEKQTDRFDCTATWIGDCLMTIAAKLNVKLPERP